MPKRDGTTLPALLVFGGLALSMGGCASTPVQPSNAAVHPAQTELSIPASSVPDPEAARRLASTSLMDLASAIKTKDFNGLYLSMAPSFRRGVPLERVSDGFRPFTDSALDLTTVDPKLLVLTPPPYFDEHGVLIVRGFEPTSVQTWHFQFGFLHTDAGWSLTSVNLSSAAE